MAGVGLPLGVVALAYGVWLTPALFWSRAHPFDSVGLGLLLAGSVLVAAPTATGFTWRRLTARDTATSAILVGAVVSTVAAFVVWQLVAYPYCPYGASTTPLDWVLPSLLVGVLIGAGLAVSALLVAVLLRSGHPWRAAVLGTGAQFGVLFVAYVTVGVMLNQPACWLPPMSG